jgi:hypothetical protein
MSETTHGWALTVPGGPMLSGKGLTIGISQVGTCNGMDALITL